MADKQKGLQRPQAPVDLFTLQPEQELVPDVVEEDLEYDDKLVEARPRRFKTSVELTPEALDLIAQLKTDYRREHQKHLALWRILDEAIKLYASRKP